MSKAAKSKAAKKGHKNTTRAKSHAGVRKAANKKHGNKSTHRGKKNA
jgi:hypothetical protein